MKKIKNIFFIFILISLIFIIHFISYAKEVQNDISKNILRLHVIANSNTNEDQKLKLLVRDKILEHMRENNFNNLEDSIKYVNENIDVLKNVAEQIILANGYAYEVKIYLDTLFFPMKKYEDISLPSGNYLAIRVVIGDGVGQNWWCVMFPPLCFSDSAYGNISDTSKEELKNTLSPDSYELITSDVEYRFKLVDFVNSLCH